MKITGTCEEIAAINHALAGGAYLELKPLTDKKNYAGMWRGFSIDFVIEEKPPVIGIIEPSVNYFTTLSNIVKPHNGIAVWKPDHLICEDGAEICHFESLRCLRGHRFDELWLDSLPNDWDEFDVCLSSVHGNRTKIHFFKELYANGTDCKI